MRSFAKRIGDLVKDEVSEDEMKKVKQEMLSEVGQFKHFSCKTGLGKTNLCTTNNGVFFLSHWHNSLKIVKTFQHRTLFQLKNYVQAIVRAADLRSHNAR